ncbi:MAG: hypothetical protein IKE55_12345 [Kiritimatiellae bacterium]|nr:hypothetical protein [Kiritimatiellia bacterium]
MKRLLITGLACAALAISANANYEWRGATGEWSDSAANWWDGLALVPWTNGAYADMPAAGAGVATDLIIASEGVTASTYQQRPGSVYSLSGGPLAASTFSMESSSGANPAVLTINNAVSANAFYLSGSVTIANDGTLLVNSYEPSTTVAAGLDTAKVTVLAGGTLVVSNFTTGTKNNYSTLYVNGGTIKYPQTNWRNHSNFSNSKIKMGPGGMHFAQSWNNQQMFLPYPIENDGGDSEGLWLDDHSSELVLYGSNTYKGGVHIQKGGSIRVQADSNLGYLPETPTNWIFFVGDGTKRESTILQSHNSSNLVTLKKNRNILIGDYVKARISTYNADQRFVIHGTFDCENKQNGILYTGGYDNNGTVVLEPPADSTNHLGRLLVHQPTIIGGGTFMLENTTQLTFSNTTGAHDEDWGVNDGSKLNIAGNGHLMVTGGLVRAGNGRMSCTSARLTISGSGTVDVSGAEFLHSYSGAATTTIRDGGKLVASSLRMAGDTPSVYSDPTKSVINVETGGTLKVSNALYCNNSGRKATLCFNGGALEWANTNRMVAIEGSYRAQTCDGITWKVLEGGMTITNTHATTFMVYVPILSGAEQDGGVTLYGPGSTLSLVGACTFNGPLTIMQGSYRPSSANNLNPSFVVCVNAGANFSMNRQSQTFARLEGSGRFQEMSDSAVLTVTEAIAPGMGTNSLGTLSFSDYGATIEDDVALEIDLDENGNSDCLDYPAQIDLSSMTLKVNDLSKLNRTKRYKIATLSGGIKDGALFKSTNLPADWGVRYYSSSHELKIVPDKGMRLVVR